MKKKYRETERQTDTYIEKDRKIDRERNIQINRKRERLQGPDNLLHALGSV